MENYLRAARRSTTVVAGHSHIDARHNAHVFGHNTSLRVEMEVTVTVMSRKSHHSSMDVNLNSSCKIRQNSSFLHDSPSELPFYAYKEQANCFGYYTFVASPRQLKSESTNVHRLESLHLL